MDGSPRKCKDSYWISVTEHAELKYGRLAVFRVNKSYEFIVDNERARLEVNLSYG